jgi:putative transposase
MDSVRYCQNHKSLQVYAYCIMPSHVHLILRAGGEQKLEDIVRDLKTFTSRSFHQLLVDKTTTYESRKNWLLLHLKDHDSNKYQFWQVGNYPIELWSDEVFYQKMDYIHMNPVVAGFVAQPEYWLYSSAMNSEAYRGKIKLAALCSSGGRPKW